MSEREERGLRRLKQDLDEAEWPAPELLARYATEPNRLTALEKQTVERALAASPLVADELATLRGFDFSKLDADRRAEPGIAAIGLVGRLRVWLLQPPVWVAVAALVALGFWLAQTRRGDLPTAPVEPAPQLAERTPGPSTSGVPDVPNVPAVPTVPDATIRGEAAPEPANPEAAAPETLVADRAPEAGPAPSATSDARPIAEEGSEAPAPSPAPRDEVLLAMAMPDYRPAYGVEPMDGGAWIVRGGEDAKVRIRLLAPDHVARACSPQPTLHWSLDRLPATGDFFLSIVDEQDEPVVADRPLARPTRAGRQTLALDALGVALPSGRTLRWSIALRADEYAAPEAFAFGWLRAAPPSAEEAAALAARGEAGRSAGYAELGCYAEALDAALAMRARHTDDPEPAKAVEQLARQAGFDPALAAEP